MLNLTWIELKMWATQLQIELNSKCQLETQLDDQFMSKYSRYVMNFIFNHDLAVKQIIQYLVDTAELKLHYEFFKVKRVEKAEFFEYINSAHANCLNS